MWTRALGPTILPYEMGNIAAAAAHVGANNGARDIPSRDDNPYSNASAAFIAFRKGWDDEMHRIRTGDDSR